MTVEEMTNAGNGWSTTLSYTYDANGNIETISENGTLKATYHYDNVNQLVREDNLWLNKTIVYTYDKGGNIYTATEYAYTTASEITSSAITTNTYTYGSSNWKDKLTAYNGTTITYDEIGNPLQYYNGYEFTWDNGRQLASATDAENTITYKYDANGIRTQKTVNGTTTYYTLEGSNVVKETNGTDTLWFYYDATGSVVSFQLNGTAYFYVKNLQGDIIAITNASGTKVVEYTYDSWGKLISTTGSLASTVGVKNPYRYRGYRYDTETGLYYLNSRYYDPEVKRFINPDSAVSGIGGNVKGYNLFSYCLNNPINSFDPYGNWPQWLDELGSNLMHGAKIIGKLILSPIKAITVEISAGIGIGVNADVVVGTIPIEIGAIASIKDSVTYEKGKFDVRNTTSTNIGATVTNVIQLSKINGHSHSYSDDNCTCNFMSSTFEQKSECIANQRIASTDATFGLSFEAYLLIGGGFSISFDPAAWGDELISIFNESMSYGK